jgi:hypothetical protein
MVITDRFIMSFGVGIGGKKDASNFSGHFRRLILRKVLSIGLEAIREGYREEDSVLSGKAGAR